MKKLIINDEHPNGIVVDLTGEDMEIMHRFIPIVPYEQRVANRVREKYSINDELAILRQRDTKPEEFEEYNSFVERIKAEEKTK